MGVEIKDVNPSYLMHLISLQAIYEAHNRNTNAALQDVRCLFLMTKQLSTIPYLGRASRTAIKLNHSNEILAKVLLYTKISPAQARAFEASLPTINFKSLADRDFLVDRIMCKYSIESSPWPYIVFTSRGMTDTSSLPFWRTLKLFTTPIQRLDEANALKRAAINYRRNQKTPFPMPPKYRDIQIQITNNEDEKMPWYMIGTRFFAPGVLPSKIPGSMETKRRERIIALALAAYHTRYHQYPSTLKSLEEFWGSALPKDLYGEKSFRYRSDGKTFKLYSIGIDRVDDGGKTDTYPRKDDIMWPNNTPPFK